MTAPALLGTLLDGKFQIEKALASGASGDVYEALHLGLGARVAVKVLRPGIPETADIRRKRFMREARVAAAIQSEHVVRVFDIVAPEDDGPTYIVMELLAGETLAERAKRVGRLPILEAVDYVLQAAKPLAEMHDAGIVHRDVKPSNLFLSRDKDGKERLKLIDFGVAAFRQPVARGESSLTLAETVIGTPRFMAPEQVQGAKVDARADVWALGVTLYVLLAGRAPFDALTPLAVMNQIEHTEPPPLASHRAEVPPELAAVVHRCLAKDPNARPADARALVEALTPFAIVAAPASSPAKRPTSARRTALIAAAIVAVGVIGIAAARSRGETVVVPQDPVATSTPTSTSTSTSTPTSTPTSTSTSTPTSTPTSTSTSTTPSARRPLPASPTPRRPLKPAKPANDDDRIE